MDLIHHLIGIARVRPVSILVLTAAMAGLYAPVHAAALRDDGTVTPHGGWAYPRGTSPVSPMAAPLSAQTYDPLAPRRDAPIFRLGDNSSSVSDDAPKATAGGSRYYSVHRQAGRQPDAPTRPAPVYLDALPVELITPPSSDDLAAPPAAPQMIRDANGRLRAVADLQDPS